MNPLAIAIHEEHGEVVQTWRECGYRAETVVCFDRHLDLKPLGPAARAALRCAAPGRLAELNRPLPWRDAPGAFGLDDFFAAGPLLGSLARLLWVRPGQPESSAAAIAAALDALALIPADHDTWAATAVRDGALSTRLCGLELEVHSAASLRRRGVPSAARVDVDLDWLADRSGGPEHSPEELLELLEELRCTARLDSLTYSIRSGFLPESLRGAAQQIARATGRRLQASPPHGQPIPERSLGRLREAGTLSSAEAERLQVEELVALGTLGLPLAGLLHLRAGEFVRGCELWFSAREAGLQASWLAYELGMHCLARREHGEALPWFERAAGEHLDTLECHAALLAAVCLLRLQRADESLRAIRLLAERHPFHRSLLRLGALSASRPAEREFFSERQRALERLIQSGERS